VKARGCPPRRPLRSPGNHAAGSPPCLPPGRSGRRGLARSAARPPFGPSQQGALSAGKRPPSTKSGSQRETPSGPPPILIPTDALKMKNSIVETLPLPHGEGEELGDHVHTFFRSEEAKFPQARRSPASHPKANSGSETGK